MVVTWMLYCIAVSALLGLAALALERALHSYGRATRWVWAGAIVLSAALPFLVSQVQWARGLALALAGWSAGPTVDVGEMLLTATGPGVNDPPEVPFWLLFDLLLFVAWIFVAPLLLLGVAVSVLVLRLRFRRCRRETVAGVPVLVSPRTGPAVVGFVRPRIVLPEWALGWEPERQRMMVEHEREHVRAGDPFLFLVALLAAVLVPWNAAAWWQLRRLRLAMEVDCDARVLRRAGDVRAYADLLLEVGRLASGVRPLAASVALTEPPSFLERRIRLMASPGVERRLRRAAGSAAMCLAILALAAAVPPQTHGVEFGSDPVFEEGDTIPERSGPVIDVSRATGQPVLENREEVARLLREAYPPQARDEGIVGLVTVQMVIDERGEVTEARAWGSSQPALRMAAADVMRRARFRPATLDGRPVAVRVTLPVTFDPEPPGGQAPPAAPVQQGPADAQDAEVPPRLQNPREVARLLRESHPPLLRDAGIGGRVSVALVIDREGAVTEARAVDAERPELAAAAVLAMRQARFSPAERRGAKVETRVTIPVTFATPRPEPAAPARNP